MTKAEIRGEKWVQFLFLAGLIGFLVCSDQIGESIKEGLLLCSQTLIPALYPTLVLSDMMTRYGAGRGASGIGSLFARIFHSHPHGAYTFGMGILCGFPVGIKEVSKAYRDGILTREEADHLMMFVGNAGVAFVVGGIGMGMRGSLKDGVALFVIQGISALFVGMLFRPSKQRLCTNNAVSSSSFSLSDSIAVATEGMLKICGTVVCFSGLFGFLNLILPDFILPIIAILLEITSACRWIADHFGTSSGLSFVLCSIAISWGGVSVLAQSALYTRTGDLSLRPYVKGKLWGSFFALVLSTLYVYVTNCG